VGESVRALSGDEEAESLLSYQSLRSLKVTVNSPWHSAEVLDPIKAQAEFLQRPEGAISTGGRALRISSETWRC
jgi:hypothetical protein